MPKPAAPSQVERRVLWAQLPIQIRTMCSYRRYDPDEPFYSSAEEAEAAGTAICEGTGQGMLFAPVILVTLPASKLVLARDICKGAEQRVQELLAVAQKHGVNAELVWELGFLNT